MRNLPTSAAIPARVMRTRSVSRRYWPGVATAEKPDPSGWRRDPPGGVPRRHTHDRMSGFMPGDVGEVVTDRGIAGDSHRPRIATQAASVACFWP